MTVMPYQPSESTPEGRAYIELQKHCSELQDEVARLQSLINTPHTADFMQAVQLEAAHQRERWGVDHDAGKEDSDWFWLIGYLAGKAIRPDATPEKRLHHIITTAAACLNWHAARSGADTRMRPGIEPPVEPSSVAVNEPVFYRCETCKEIMLAAHLVGTDSHERIEETSEGQPYQVTCGPVRPSVLSAGEYINRFLPANWMNDSSLETWFPITAEELKRLKDERAAQPPPDLLREVVDALECRDPSEAHYCPNCDRSLYDITQKVRASLTKNEGPACSAVPAQEVASQDVTASASRKSVESDLAPPSVEPAASSCEEPEPCVSHLALKSFEKKLRQLSQAMGNPAVEWDEDGSLEEALIDEAIRRLAEEYKRGFCEASAILRKFGPERVLARADEFRASSSVTKDAGECGACDKPGEHCANVHGICSRHGGRAHETSAPRWQRADKPWSEYPIGTVARQSWTGCKWTKTERGWKAHVGDTFPIPGGADEVAVSETPRL